MQGTWHMLRHAIEMLVIVFPSQKTCAPAPFSVDGTSSLLSFHRICAPIDNVAITFLSTADCRHHATACVNIITRRPQADGKQF